MNERSDQKRTKYYRRAHSAAMRRRRIRFCLLFVGVIAAAAALFCLPHFLNRIPGSPDSSSFLKNDSSDPAIRIVNPPEGGQNGDSAALTEGTSDSSGTGEAGASGSDTPWYLLLVNRTHPLPDGYQDQLTLTELDNGQSVDSRIYPALQSMFDAMRSDGVYPVVASGFRTTEKQQSLMDERIASFESQGYSAAEAKKKAETWVAVPGTSEHQLGSAVDINADGIHSAGYQVYEWLDKHAHEYGFIHRYPDDKTKITGISNEPWHYRYVGEEAAAEIHRRGICLEEYLDAVSTAP